MRKISIFLGLVCLLAVVSLSVRGQSGQEVCLVNETDGSKLVLFLNTGAFKYVGSDGFATSGTGQVKTNGCVASLNGATADATVVADVNLCDRIGKANIQVTSPQFASQRAIIDSNLDDNGCVSAAAPDGGDPVEEPSGEWVIVQDADSFLVFHTLTGDYKYTNCGNGTVFSGTGQIKRNGCEVALEDIRTGSRVVASVNLCEHAGKASVEVFQTAKSTTGEATTQTMSDVISDTNMLDNTGACPAK
jgi:hypothetical protein